MQSSWHLNAILAASMHSELNVLGSPGALGIARYINVKEAKWPTLPDLMIMSSVIERHSLSLPPCITLCIIPAPCCLKVVEKSSISFHKSFIFSTRRCAVCARSSGDRASALELYSCSYVSPKMLPVLIQTLITFSQGLASWVLPNWRGIEISQSCMMEVRPNRKESPLSSM